MNTALTQQRAVEIAEQQGFHVLFQKELHAAMEQYHREAIAARCPDCGERNPAEIHTCSPQQPASVEPVAWEHKKPTVNDSGETVGYSTWKPGKGMSGWPVRALYTTPPDAEARAECERLRKDAERYRLLRRGQRWSVIDGIGNTLRADELDKAIDAALAAKGEKPCE